jgi:hypothetical protein
MKAFQRTVVLFSILVLLPHALAVDTPGGFKDLLQVEKGAPFHPLFPFFVGGSNYVGVIVIAHNPNKPEAFFENIDSPGYLNPDSVGQLSVENHDILGGKYSQTHNIGAAMAFAQLDRIGQAAKSPPNATNLLAKTCEPSNTKEIATALPDKSASSTPTPTPASTPPGGKAPGTSSSSRNSENCQQSTMTSTGIDISKFSGATVTISKAHLAYYPLQTLTRLQNSSNGPLSALGKQVFIDDPDAWIVSRIVIVDSVTYDLTSTTDLDAGLFAKLTAWLPTISAKYKSRNTVSVTSQVPIVVGYKLWRPFSKVVGSSVDTPKAPGITLDAAGVERVLTFGDK